MAIMHHTASEHSCLPPHPLAGGLPEAGMGMCPAVHVSPVQIPAGADGVTPCWATRVYPRQDVDAWVSQIERLHDAGPDAYVQRAKALLAAALDYICSGPQHLRQLLAWLETHSA